MIFQGLRFRFGRSISQHEAAELRALLGLFGGEMADADLENAVLISHSLQDSDSRQTASVVTPAWLYRSLFHGTHQPVESFSPDPSKICSGVVVFVDESVPQDDQETIMAGVEHYGGDWKLELCASVTHLVTLKKSRFPASPHDHAPGTSAEHLEWLRRSDGIFRIIRPHYFSDLFSVERRIPEDFYLIKSDSVPETSSSNSKAAVRATSATQVLSAHSFYFDPELLSNDLVDKYKADLKAMGAKISDSISETVDCFVTNHSESFVFQTSMEVGKTVGTIYWLADIVSQKRFTEPADKLLSYPFSKEPISGIKGLRISISNYTGKSREILMHLIKRMGGTFTPNFSNTNTHLICAKPSGEKYDMAVKWNLHVVNHLWLEDCWRSWALVSVAKPQYLIHSSSFSTIVGCVPASKRKSPADDDEKVIFSETLQDVRAKVASIPKFMFTGFRPIPQQVQEFESLGAKLTANSSECTHLIIGNFSRTEKLLCGIGTCTFIVSSAWFTDSIRRGKLLDPEDYVAEDEVFETLYSFSLRSSLRLAQSRKLLSGMKFTSTPLVSLKPQTLTKIITSHGGQYHLFNKRDLTDNSDVVVISCEQDRSLFQQSDNSKIYTIDFLLVSLLQQNLDLSSKRFSLL